MHDPMTVAFEIRRPWREKPNQCWPKGYCPSLITILHRDPETDGTDDSCGWFMRARHGDQKVRQAIRNDFAFDWDADFGGWFDKAGKPLFTVPGIVISMFWLAAFHHFRKNRRKVERFMRRHLPDILHFAENTVDSMHPAIVGKYGIEPREDRIDSAASVVYGYVLRWTRPWWRHPRWHVHHWRFQVHPWQALKRMLTRCNTCGKRFGYGEIVVQAGGRRDEKTQRWVPHLHHSACSGVGLAVPANDPAANT